MLKTVRFAKVSSRLHLTIVSMGVVNNTTIGKYYNEAMVAFIEKMKKDHLPVFIGTTSSEYKPARVENVNSEVYKEFKAICAQKDITASQGINVALKDWLDTTK